MMTKVHRAILREYGTLFGRVVMGLLFVFSGLMMALTDGILGVSGMIADIGFPAAELLAWLIIAVKVLGGAALIVGYRVGYASVALIAFLLLTVVFVHGDYMNDINFFKNLALVGGLLYVLAYGPGEGWSLAKSSSRTPSVTDEVVENFTV